MYAYKMILINRLREYKRLIENMLLESIFISIVVIFFLYTLGQLYIPILESMDTINEKVLIVISIFLILINLKRTFINAKPIIVIKPMTLFLFNDKKLCSYFIIKYGYITIKNIILSILLSICIFGFKFHRGYLHITWLIFFLKESGDFLSWILYNTKKNRIIWQIISIAAMATFILGKYDARIVLLSATISFGLLIYAVGFLKLDYLKYQEDIIYLEKILTAQNSKNTILLSQYAKEKIVMSLPKNQKASILLKKYPIIWKTFLSIKRTGKTPLLVGAGFFAISFFIYVIPFFEQLPFLEIEEIRYVLLLGSVIMFYQIVIRTFSDQLEDLMSKNREGLFIPIELMSLIKQFTVIPIVLLMVITVIVSFLLKSNILFGFIFFIIIAIYQIATLYLTIKNKALLKKAYFIINIVMFFMTYLLLLK